MLKKCQWCTRTGSFFEDKGSRIKNCNDWEFCSRKNIDNISLNSFLIVIFTFKCLKKVTGFSVCQDSAQNKTEKRLVDLGFSKRVILMDFDFWSIMDCRTFMDVVRRKVELAKEKIDLQCLSGEFIETERNKSARKSAWFFWKIYWLKH